VGFDKEYVTATTIDGQEAVVACRDLIRATHCYAIVIRDGKILISPQWEDNGFVFPGGTVELGEDHMLGVVREVREETGYEIKLRNVVGVYTSIFMNFKKYRAQHSLLVYYSADVVKGRLSTDGFDEHEAHYMKKARWVTLEELKSMRFMCNTQEPIKGLMKYLERKVKASNCKVCP